MRNTKNVVTLVLVIVMVFSMMPVVSFANSEIIVTIDGQQVTFADQGPVIIDGRTLVPVGGVFGAIDFVPTWDGATRTATLTRSDFTIVITIDNATFTTNGVQHTLDVPAQIVNGRTMLPIRAVLESIGYDLDWDSSTRTVVIETSTSSTALPASLPITGSPAEPFDAVFFGEQDMRWMEGYSHREFWRLENAYEYFRNHPIATNNFVLPLSNFPMPIELGQVFVIRFTRLDGTYFYNFFRYSGYVWSGHPSTQRFIVEEYPTWVVVDEQNVSQIGRRLGVDYTILPREYFINQGNGYIRWQFIELHEPINLLDFPTNLTFQSPADAEIGDVYIMTFPEGFSNVHINVGPGENDIFWFNASDVVLGPQETIDAGVITRAHQRAEQQVEQQARLARFGMSRQYTSENFYWYSTRDNAQWLPYMAIELESRFSVILETFGIDYFPDRKTILYFSNHGMTEWGRDGYFGTERANYVYTTYMGFANEIAGVILMYLTRPTGNTTPSDYMIRLMIHEAVHIIQLFIEYGSDSDPVPKWLMEGTAVYFEGRSSDQFEDILSRGIRDNNIRTLSYLEGLVWGSDSSSSAWDVWSAAMVQFIHENFGFEYVVELHENYDIEAVFGISRTEFERQWHQWLRNNFQ